MLLSDRDLRAAINAERLGIRPWDPAMLQPASIDVRLSNAFRVFNWGPLGQPPYDVIDPAQEMPDLMQLEEVEDGQPFRLRSGDFVLGSTVEEIALPVDLAARLEGKSSLGRLGLVVHSTAGFIDPGFEGTITLELSNLSPLTILLWPGMKIGQLAVTEMTTPAEFPYGSAVYGSRYQNQRGPTASRSWRGFRRTPVPPAS